MRDLFLEFTNIPLDQNGNSPWNKQESNKISIYLWNS